MIFRHLLNMRSHPTWVRGLKLQSYGILLPRRKSHPTWVRGLKRAGETSADGTVASHPTCVRGLKLLLFYNTVSRLGVAPYMGAWIETCFRAGPCLSRSRTLHGCVD